MRSWRAPISSSVARAKSWTPVRSWIHGARLPDGQIGICLSESIAAYVKPIRQKYPASIFLKIMIYLRHPALITHPTIECLRPAILRQRRSLLFLAANRKCMALVGRPVASTTSSRTNRNILLISTPGVAMRWITADGERAVISFAVKCNLSLLRSKHDERCSGYLDLRKSSADGT